MLCTPTVGWLQSAPMFLGDPRSTWNSIRLVVAVVKGRGSLLESCNQVFGDRKYVEEMCKTCNLDRPERTIEDAPAVA